MRPWRGCSCESWSRPSRRGPRCRTWSPRAADRQVEAITVNRWPHGYAYGYMDLYDPDWPAGEAPHELGRRSFGRVSIANSDAEALAYVQGAIDAAWRAVEERLSL